MAMACEIKGDGAGNGFINTVVVYVIGNVS